MRRRIVRPVRPAVRFVVVLTILLAGHVWAAPATAERFVVVTNGTQVGHLQVTRAGHRLSVEYRVSDNGRGPAIQEALELGADGLPRRWRIRGQAESGAQVRESFLWRSGRASWRSLGDRGEASAREPRLYLANDASPYAFGLYVRALVKAPGKVLPAWPEGTVRAQYVRDIMLGSSTADRPVSVWALWGIRLEPVLVMVGPQLEFLGWLDSERLVIPRAWLADSAAMQDMATELSFALLHEMTQRIAHRFDGPVRLRNVRVLDSSAGTLSEPTTIEVVQGRIASLRAEAPAGADAVIIDGEGGTVVPGLFDMHGHLSAWQGPLYLAAGITTVRDMGNDNAQLLKLVDSIDSGDVAGPSVVRAGFLEGESPYSASGGFTVGSLPDALDKVRWYAAQGYRQLKIYNSVHPDWVAPIAAEAHRSGMRVAGHVPAFMSSAQAIRAGYDEISHLNQLLLSLLIDPVQDDTRTTFRFTALGERTALLDLRGKEFQSLVSLMRESGTALDPTIAILSHMLLAQAGRTTPVTGPWLGHLPAPLARRGRSAFLDIPRDRQARYRESEARLLEALKRLYDAGVTLLPGTDYSPGFMLASELEAWQRAGIAPAEVMRLATLGCARYLGMERERGTIERGKRADLLLVQGDPTQDVRTLRHVRLVMKDGIVFFPDEIHSELQVKPFASRPPLISSSR